jgi:hypothetical protein
MAKMYHKNLSTGHGGRWEDGEHIKTDVKKPWARVSLILSGFWIIVAGSIEHRFYIRFNEWQDTHWEKFMYWLKPFIFSPFLILVLVICVILIHAYWKGRQERKEEEKEINRQENQKAFVAEIVAQTLASAAPRIYLGIQDTAEQIFPGAQFILSNHGKITAHNIQIQPFKLCRKPVTFPLVSYIHPTQEFGVQATVSDSGNMLKHNIFYWLNKDWDGGGKLTNDCLIDIFIKYYDPSGRRFEAAMTMIFHPISHMMNQKIDPNAPQFLRRQPDVSLEYRNTKTLDTLQFAYYTYSSEALWRTSSIPINKSRSSRLWRKAPASALSSA